MTGGSSEDNVKLTGAGRTDIRLLRGGMLARRVAATFGRQLFAIGCQLGSAIILARSLGPAGNGIYGLAIMVPMLLGSLLNLGLPAANVYFIARGELSVRAAVRMNLQAAIALGLVGCGSSVLAAIYLGDELFPEVPLDVLLTAASLVPISLLYVLFTAILQGTQDFKQYNITLALPASVGLVIIASLWAGLLLSPKAALLAWGAGQAAGLAIAVKFLLRKAPPEVAAPAVPARRCLARSVRYGLLAYSSNLVTFITYKVSLFLVNLMLGPSAAGLYLVSTQLGERLWLLSQAVSTVLFPHLSELHDAEGVRRRLTPIVTRWTIYAAAAASLFVGLLASELIVLLFGQAYAEAGRILIFLLPGIVVLSGARVLANDLSARGRPGLNALTAATALVTNIGANLILIPFQGATGAALASSIGYLCASLVSTILYARLSGNEWWRPIVPQRVDWDILTHILRMAVSHVRRYRPGRDGTVRR